MQVRPEIHKSVISMGVLTKQGILSSCYPDGRLELSIGKEGLLYTHEQKSHVSFAKPLVIKARMNISENFMADACITDKRRLWHAILSHSNVACAMRKK